MHRWSLGMDKEFHPTLDNGCNHFSMLALKLTHVSKRGPRQSMVWDNTITFHPITHIRHRSRLSLYKSDLCLLKLLLCLASDRLDSQSEAMLKNSYSQIWIWTSHTSHYKNLVIGQFPLPHTVPSLRWDTGIHRFKNTTKQLFHNVRGSRCYCTFQHILADVIIMIHLEFILNQSDWTHFGLVMPATWNRWSWSTLSQIRVASLSPTSGFYVFFVVSQAKLLQKSRISGDLRRSVYEDYCVINMYWANWVSWR